MPDLATVTSADWTTGALFDLTTIGGGDAEAKKTGSRWSTGQVVLLAMISFVGILLNATALRVFTKKKNRNTATNLYLMHLAVADLMMCLLTIPLQISDVYNVFTWTRFGCSVHVFLRYGIALVSLNTIVVIAIERCVAVVLPAKFAALATPRNIKIHLALIWTAVVVEMIYPSAIVKLNSRSNCSLLHSKSSYVYIFTVVVLLPSAVLVLAYGTIIVTVLRRQWSDRANVRMTSALSESADDKKENSYSRINARLIVMCAIITVLFMFCWYPTLLLIYLRRYNGVVLSSTVNDYIRVAYYFHPMLNPLVYFFVDPRFRSIAVRLFCPKKVDNDNISMASATQVETAHD